MSKNASSEPTGPTTLREAIERLENAGHDKIGDFSAVLEKEYPGLKQALDQLKPFLQDIKSNGEAEVSKAKKRVEEKVQKNPWLILGIVGFIAFVVGWVFSRNQKD